MLINLPQLIYSDRGNPHHWLTRLTQEDFLFKLITLHQLYFHLSPAPEEEEDIWSNAWQCVLCTWAQKVKCMYQSTDVYKVQSALITSTIYNKIYFYHACQPKGFGEFISKASMPNCSIALPAALVYLLHPFHWFAYTAAAPVKWCSTSVACFGLPLAIFQKYIYNHSYNHTLLSSGTFFLQLSADRCFWRQGFWEAL